MTLFASLPGDPVRFVPNDPNAPILYGADALAMLDPKEDEDEEDGASRTLDGRPPRQLTRGRGRTLAGD